VVVALTGHSNGTVYIWKCKLAHGELLMIMATQDTVTAAICMWLYM